MLLAAFVGALTGLGVAGFDTAVTRGVQAMDDLPLWLTAVAPFVGLSVAGLVLYVCGPSASPSTVDEYLHAFHDPEYTLALRPLVARMIAGIANVGQWRADGVGGTVVVSRGGDRRHTPTALSAPVLRGTASTVLVGVRVRGSPRSSRRGNGAVFARGPLPRDLARYMLGRP